jgi:antirestriction protein ArdC
MEERYSTAFHELAHSTGHQSRLNRLRTTARFGSESYSREELVAEITAAALVNHIGIETKGTFRNSAAYIQNWLTALRNDKRLIVSASGMASKAFEYITATS